jgi:hypothetical protein
MRKLKAQGEKPKAKNVRNQSRNKKLLALGFKLKA